MTLLRVENLSLAFGSLMAVRGLSFDVARGETLALVGESGSGKSATALAILRLIERDGGRIAGGRILLDGIDLAALPDAAMQPIRGNRIAMVFQEPMTALNPVLPLGEQLAEVLRLHRGLTRAAARTAAAAAMARVRIPDPDRRLSQFAHQLSGGMRQRVMIAMALACRPDLLIADEPTTALDVTTQAEILGLMNELQAEIGMGLLFITHDMGVVAEMADRVMVLKDGQKVEEAAVRQLFAAPQADYTRELMAATPRLGAGGPRPVRAADPVLQVQHLSVRFALPAAPFAAVQEHHAVSDVSLTVGRGETLGLVGESGCGKSTLARACLRLIEPDAGRIILAGTDITQLGPHDLRQMRRAAQIVFQDPMASLNPRLPVLDLITEPALIHGTVTRKGRAELAADLLAKVGLSADAMTRYPHEFSGGQRQRLCIARALSLRPALIVADEAVSALDVSVGRQITDLMTQLQVDEGLSFLFISHDIAVVERVAHRIAVMRAGRIVETGPASDVLGRPVHPYTRHLLVAVPVPDPTRPRARLAAELPRPSNIFPRGTPRQPSRMVEVAPNHFVATDSILPGILPAAVAVPSAPPVQEGDHRKTPQGALP